jgi:hypothetical protein
MRFGGDEVQEGQAAAPAPHNHAAGRRILGRVEGQGVRGTQLEDQSEENRAQHHDGESGAQDGAADTAAKGGALFVREISARVGPNTADLQQGQGGSGEDAPAQDAPRLLDVRGGDGRVLADARDEAGMRKSQESLPLAGILPQDSPCGQHVHRLVHRALRQLAARREFAGGEPILVGAREQNPHGHRLAGVDDSAMEEGIKDSAGAARAFVAACGGHALLDRGVATICKSAGRQGPGRQRSAAMSVGQASLEERAGVERGLFQDLGHLGLAQSTKLHPGARGWRDGGDVVQALQAMKGRAVDAQEQAQSAARAGHGDLEQRGQGGQGSGRGRVRVVPSRSSRWSSTSRCRPARSARHADQVVGRAFARHRVVRRARAPALATIPARNWRSCPGTPWPRRAGKAGAKGRHAGARSCPRRARRTGRPRARHPW